MKKILLLLLIVMNYTVSFSQTTEKPKTANEILTRHNFQDNIAFLAAEKIPLETLLSMWDDTQNALFECVDDAVKMRLNILDKKLVMRITAQGYDLSEKMKLVSEQQEKRIAEKKELLAQKETETEAKKQLLAQNNAKIQDLDKKIETLKTKTEATKKVAQSLKIDK